MIIMLKITLTSISVECILFTLILMYILEVVFIISVFHITLKHSHIPNVTEPRIDHKPISIPVPIVIRGN